MRNDSPKNDTSIAGQSAAHLIAMDDSLASLLLNHGIRIRDFILLSFLSDQGPMTILRLSRVVGIEPDKTLKSIKRLSTVNLVVREATPNTDVHESIAGLTTRGEDIARRISAQLD